MSKSLNHDHGSAKRWTRSKKNIFVKSAKLTDGEYLHLLLSLSPKSADPFDVTAYDALKDCQSAYHKQAIWIIGSSAFGILSHLGFLTKAGASGLELAPAIFSHAALLMLSVSTMIFCFTYSKASMISAWFAEKYRRGTASDKAELLISFPRAFWHFQFMRAAIGTPPHIFKKGGIAGAIVSLALILLGLTIYTLGSLSLWALIAIDVWYAEGVNPLVTWFTLSLATISVLLGWTSPFYQNFKREYLHYGLSNRLNALDGPAKERATLRIMLAAERLGLLDDIEDTQKAK